MDLVELNRVAKAMVAPGKGILAADESGGTIKKRFTAIGVESTETSRRDYRELLFRSAKAMADRISGVILFDETMRQKSEDGTKLVEVIAKAGALPGIKVDKGAKPLASAKLRLEPELSVLDIGCGWGSLAIWLARHHDVNVTGLTLSREQLRVARARVKEAGLDHRVRLELMDYREHTGRYDRIVSVGMFEHVGKRNHVSYFRTASNCMAPDGVMLMHTIGNKLEPEPVNPWIRRHVFPGGYIPTISEVARAVEKVGFCTADLEIWRHHYALTLEAWNERFQAVREQFARLRGERFCRMWEFYLVSCQTAFEAGNLVVQQWQLTRDNLVVPITRDYLYARSDAQVVPPEGSARRPAARVVRPVSDKRVSGEPER
jgi:cyclopropane fatty-acyl-phospholipid synthase-like methyltransferase